MPPRRLLALAMVEAVMSIVWPGFANGGRVALSATAATFLTDRLVPGGICTPSRLSMLFRLCAVNCAWPVLSPVPSRPTTRP